MAASQQKAAEAFLPVLYSAWVRKAGAELERVTGAAEGTTLHFGKHPKVVRRRVDKAVTSPGHLPVASACANRGSAGHHTGDDAKPAPHNWT